MSFFDFDDLDLPISKTQTLLKKDNTSLLKKSEKFLKKSDYFRFLKVCFVNSKNLNYS